MNRIKFMQGYWELSPSCNSFKEYDAQVLITRMLSMYILGKDGDIKMLHPFQILDVLGNDRQAGKKFKQALYDLVDKLPDDDWHKLCKQCGFIDESSNA